MSKHRMVFVLKFSFIKQEPSDMKTGYNPSTYSKGALIGAPLLFDKVRAHTRIRRAIPTL